MIEKTATFAERLQELMRVRGLSKSELAKLCDIDRSNITRYCKGDYEAKQDVMYKIASRLRVNVPWLRGYDVPMDAAIVVDESNLDDVMKLYGTQEDAAPASAARDRVLKAFDQMDPELQEMFAAQAEAALAARQSRDNH